MPPPYSASQRSAIAQFVGFTQAKDSVAAKVRGPFVFQVNCGDYPCRGKEWQIMAEPCP